GTAARRGRGRSDFAPPTGLHDSGRRRPALLRRRRARRRTPSRRTAQGSSASSSYDLPQRACRRVEPDEWDARSVERVARRHSGRSFRRAIAWDAMSDALERLGAALAEHYTIEREVGAGGMAAVYLARDLKHDRKVARKGLR